MKCAGLRQALNSDRGRLRIGGCPPRADETRRLLFGLRGLVVEPAGGAGRAGGRSRLTLVEPGKGWELFEGRELSVGERGGKSKASLCAQALQTG